MDSNNTNDQTLTLTVDQLRKMEILTACNHFAQTVLNITNDLNEQGYTDRSMPRFPKAALLQLMKKQPAINTVLRGENLHHYLCTKLILPSLENHVPNILPPEDRPPTSWDDLIDQLYLGYQIIRCKHATVLRSYLIYGQWLQRAFTEINNPINRSPYRGKWDKWLTDNNIGIKTGHARMLRILARKFYEYKRFQKLSIPLTELWKKRKEIEDMLQDQLIATFWKEPA